MTKTNIRVYLKLTGQSDPSEITKHLGIEPTESFKKGDLNIARNGRILSGGLPNRISFWSLETKPIDSIILDDHLEEIFSMIADIPNLKSLPNGWEGMIQVVTEMYEEQTPALGINLEHIKKLCEYNFEIDIDSYICGSSKND